MARVNDPLAMLGALLDGRFGTWITTVLTALIAGAFGIWYGDRVGLRRARRERLREIYSGIMANAVRLTPMSLGRRAPVEGVEDGDEPLPPAEEIDRLNARLMTEPGVDEDEVLKAFFGVYNFSPIYRVDRHNQRRGDDVPEKELRKNREVIERSLSDLQTAIRKRLA